MGIVRAVKLLSIMRGLINNRFSDASQLMSEMHGLPQKVGQHLTLYNGRDFDTHFANLYNQGKTEQIAIEAIVQKLGLQGNVTGVVARASIGQVYKVVSTAGTLAIKAKYPSIETQLRSDFKVLSTLVWPLRFLPLRNSALPTMIKDLSGIILAECDYLHEAGNQRLFHDHFKNYPGLYIPEVICNNNEAIASEWIEGKSLAKNDEWFVNRYLEFLLLSIKKLGAVHTDPHPGNFLVEGVDHASRLVIVDFGSVIRLNNQEQQAITRLLLGEYIDEHEIYNDLVILGVGRNSLDQYLEVLGDLVSILLEPFYYDGRYDFADWRMQYKLNTLLAYGTWEEPLVLSPKLLLFIRTIQGLYYYARKDSIVINWRELTSKYLG